MTSAILAPKTNEDFPVWDDLFLVRGREAL